MSATRWLIEHKIDFSLNEIEIPLICLKLCSSVSCKVDLKVDCEGMDLELNEKLMGVNNFVQHYGIKIGEILLKYWRS